MPDAGSSPAPDAEALRSEISELRLKLARLDSSSWEVFWHVGFVMNLERFLWSKQRCFFYFQLIVVIIKYFTIKLTMIYESILEENTKTSRSKAYTLEEGNKPTEAMETDNQLLRNEESYSESNIYIMEDEAQILQQEVRKINNIAYTIESLAINAEKRVEFLSSEVKKIESIITEQWIQIRQFEQAFVVTKMMTSKVHKRRFSEGAYKWSGKDILLKYVRNVDLHGMFLAGASKFHKAIQYQCSPDVDVPNAFFLGGSISRSCISLPYKQFKISISSAQQIHYKVPFFYSLKAITVWLCFSLPEFYTFAFICLATFIGLF
uniref:Uncharacterized protein n=1 Tax=Aegilops tauschii TaxID=37682 RepID=M8BEE8_AEGTA